MSSDPRFGYATEIYYILRSMMHIIDYLEVTAKPTIY